MEPRRSSFVRSLQWLICALGLAAGGASGTSTDGYHAIQIVPVTVKSGSFVSSYFIHNPNSTSIDVDVTFYQGGGYDALGTTSPTPLSCGTKTVAAGTVSTFVDLVALCPGAGAGFGWIWAEEVTPGAAVLNSGAIADVNGARPFNIFQRIDNVQGTAGFETEGYPAQTFASALGVYVTGLKRAEATVSTPKFQTNCFAGALNEAVTLTLTLLNGATQATIATRTISLAAHQLVRFLDVSSFGFVDNPGASATGDYSNAILKVTTAVPGNLRPPGSVVFCTVQNNTLFDADFRIGKAVPARDFHVIRMQGQIYDALVNPSSPASFTLGTYPSERSRHLAYFKNPDFVNCFLTSGTYVPLTSAAKMEIRLIDPLGNLAAGGAGAVAITDFYTGDKGSYTAGANGIWSIDVQASDNSGTSNGVAYGIVCRSGSGAGPYEWIGRNLPHS